MKNKNPKKLTPRGLLGQRGVNLIERIVLDMKSRWIPGGPNEVGIDGYIELFDSSTHSPIGSHIAVQSKALSSFENETTEGFDYWCKPRDIDYWVSGNLPIILVVSRPETEEAYWISIKDHFKDSKNKTSTKVHFNKSKQRLLSTSFEDLVAIGKSPEIGFYSPPLPKAERLFSNLIPLTKYPDNIWLASTGARKPRDVWQKLAKIGGLYDGAWMLHEKKILSFHNLEEYPWSEICDRGTMEEFESDEWAASEDSDRKRQFVQLLNLTLKSQLGPEVRYWPSEDCYAFSGSVEDGDIQKEYRSVKRKSKITVVSRYNKTNKNGRVFVWLRHHAFKGQFKYFDDQWYLEITPTYRFTYDGCNLDRFHEDRLKGIKRIEGNRAVLSSVLFWADYIGEKNDLFKARNIPLSFGRPLSFELEHGINDKEWSAKNEEENSKAQDDVESFLPLFDEQVDDEY